MNYEDIKEEIKEKPFASIDSDDVQRVLFALALCVIQSKNDKNKKHHHPDFLKTYFKLKNQWRISHVFNWEEDF